MISYQSIPSSIPSQDECDTRVENKLFFYSRNAILSVILFGACCGVSIGYFMFSGGISSGSIALDGANVVHLARTTESKSIFNTLPLEERNEFSLVEKPYNLALTTSPPNNLTYMNSITAFEILTDPSTINTHYFFYESGLEAQINQAYCAVATSAAVLNSLRYHPNFDVPLAHVYSPYPFATQGGVLLNECVNERVIQYSHGRDGVLLWPQGLGLDQVVKLLDCHLNEGTNEGKWTVRSRRFDSDNLNVDIMREEMITALNDTDSRLAINYYRSALGQVGGGHFSPIGAYNPDTDSFLIIDVAKYKYPPVWAPAEHLFASLATIDSCGTWNYPNGQKLLTSSIRNYEEAKVVLGCEYSSRGYVVVSKI